MEELQEKLIEAVTNSLNDFPHLWVVNNPLCDPETNIEHINTDLCVIYKPTPWGTQLTIATCLLDLRIKVRYTNKDYKKLDRLCEEKREGDCNDEDLYIEGILRELKEEK